MFVYGWSVLVLKFGLLILSFYLMGSFVLRVKVDPYWDLFERNLNFTKF